MIVVLGATGKVGRATIRELRGRGAPVRAVVRDPANAGELAAWGCDIAVADLRDSTRVRTAPDGAEAMQVICPMIARREDASLEMRGTIDAMCDALTCEDCGDLRPWCTSQ